MKVQSFPYISYKVYYHSHGKISIKFGVFPSKFSYFLRFLYAFRVIFAGINIQGFNFCFNFRLISF